jgi:AraC-like DNA-binding protein
LSQKLTFSSKDLPSHLDNEAKFKLWQDLYSEKFGSVELGISAEIPFHANIETLPIGPLIYASVTSSINRVTRTKAGVRADKRVDYALVINGPQGMPISGTYRKTELSVGAASAFLYDLAEPVAMTGGDSNTWMKVIIPRQIFDNAFPAIGNRQAHNHQDLAIAADHEPLQLLRHYLKFLDDGPLLLTPGITDHVTSTIIDLVGLATGAKGDEAEVAGLRGMRAARLQAVLGHIRANYSDPAISAQYVAGQLGLSTRYIHDLLQESGRGFSDRVLELRLQRAKAMLEDEQFRGSRIGEIAFAVGFGDISYFNRSFRRRFGCSPGAAR